MFFYCARIGLRKKAPKGKERLSRPSESGAELEGGFCNRSVAVRRRSLFLYRETEAVSSRILDPPSSADEAFFQRVTGGKMGFHRFLLLQR